VNVKGGLERVREGNLLYSDEVGRDACGIGGIAARDGAPSAEVLRKAVLALKCMEHRGGVCGEAGDGSGITTAIPQVFLKEEAKRLKLDRARYLKNEDSLAVGVVFFSERDPARLDQARVLIRRTLEGGPVEFLGVRPVPTNDDALPGRAKRTKPAAIEQFLLRLVGEPAEVERWLYLRRLNCVPASRRPVLRPISLRCQRGSSATRGCSRARNWRTIMPIFRTRLTRRESQHFIAVTAPTPFRTGFLPSRSG
jgi:glutamate synthase domain-containing protein 1